VAETEVQCATESADANLVALGQTKGTGAALTLLVRPQEAVSAIQALSQAYVDYYGAVADANRAQFRLYRALGRPAQYVIQDQPGPTSCGTATSLPLPIPVGAHLLAPEPVIDAPRPQ
jgi:hypothetical protein